MRTTSDLSGRVLDARYRVDRIVATGGMGTVYEGFDSRLERIVAVKVMNDNLVYEPGFTERFITEARAAARLSDPHVVAVYDRGRTADAVYLVMEYVPGRTLRQELTWGGRLPVARSLDILHGALKGLQAAHAAGFVHGDMKPDNVLLGDRGDIKVTDFGLARAIEDGDHRASMLLGTAAYLAPEQATDRTPDPRSDLYSTGILLFEMLTGHVPFRADSADDVLALHRTQRVPNPSRFVEVDAGLDALCAKATAKDPADRYQTATQMLVDVAALRRRANPDEGRPQEVASAPPLPPVVTPTSSPTVVPDLDPVAWPTDPRPEPQVPQTEQIPAVVITPSSQSQAPPPPVAKPPGSGGSAGKQPAVKQRKRRTGPILLLMLLAVLIGVGYFAWQWGTTETVATPKLAGLSRLEALAELRDAGLTMKVSDEKFSEKRKAGTVISSDPRAGERIALEGVVSVVLSKGPERYEVPVLRGLTQDAAAKKLGKQNLQVGQVMQDYSRNVAPGLVVRSDPKAGEKLKRGTSVSLTVSLGPEPVVIPDVRGMTVDQAISTIRAAGLKTSSTERYDDLVPFGQVIGTEPVSGTTAYRGDRITMTISKGSQSIPVPSVVGMDTKSAETLLENAGFRVTTREQFGVTIANRVISQDPGGGTVAPRGTLVTLTVT